MRGASLLAATLGLLVACTPAPDRHSPAVAAPPSPAAAKHYTMVCKNSETGASVACGTKNAVMVGMKED